MILSTAQLQLFWREWANTCRAMHWTRDAGLTADQINQHRKEFLAKCGYDSLTKVNRTDGFTRVISELRVLQGVDLKAAREAGDPSLNEARVFRNKILAEIIPCLELYMDDVRGYLTTILAEKFRWHKTDRPDREPTLMDLDGRQLKQILFTLSARLNSKRKDAGDSIHDMRTRAGLDCDCSDCQSSRNHRTGVAEILAPF